MIFDIETFEVGEAQAKYLVHGYDDVLWTDDWEEALSYIMQSLMAVEEPKQIPRKFYAEIDKIKEGNMHSEICPVCKGKGEIPNLEGTRFPMVCHGCKGRGWVEVRDSGYPFIPCEPPAPILPYIDPYPYYPPYVPAPFDPGPWVCENDQTAIQQKDFPQWIFIVRN